MTIDDKLLAGHKINKLHNLKINIKRGDFVFIMLKFENLYCYRVDR